MVKGYRNFDAMQISCGVSPVVPDKRAAPTPGAQPGHEEAYGASGDKIVARFDTGFRQAVVSSGIATQRCARGRARACF